MYNKCSAVWVIAKPAKKRPPFYFKGPPVIAPLGGYALGPLPAPLLLGHYAHCNACHTTPATKPA